MSLEDSQCVDITQPIEVTDMESGYTASLQ